MRSFWGLFAVCILETGFVTAKPVVTTPKGRVTYRGTAQGSVEHFQNIKFAHDTSGARRFAPPVPFSPPPGTEIDASLPGSACPQTQAAMPPFFDKTKEMSEDCLNLRIARSQGTTSGQKLPVVIWLHGGGVVKGSAYDSHFEPDNLINHSKTINTPVIYVAIHYRLTIFGFARSSTLKDQHSLNVGMRDQRAGFQWVKDNIEAFGGDPKKITVFGLSSGGTFTSLHLMAYGGEQGVPFNQMWAMSGPPGTALNLSSDVTEVHTTAVAQSVGCEQEKESEMLQCLREVPMETLLETAMKYSVANHPPAGLFTFIPSVDDDMFPDRPSSLYKAGRFVRGVPIVFGWTQDDGAMNVGPAHLIQTEDDMKPAIQKFAPALDDYDFAQLFLRYTAAEFEDRVNNYECAKEEDDPKVSVHYFRLSQLLRDMLFTCSSIDFGFEMSKQSHDLGLESHGVRLYALNQSMLTPLWKGAGMPYVGVSHGSDTNYIFNGVFPEGPISENDQELSRMLTDAFIRFASTGDPNSPESKHWPNAFTFDGTQMHQSDPQGLHVQVMGGPLGTGSSYQTSASDDLIHDVNQEIMDAGGDQIEDMQSYSMGAMSSKASRLRNQVLAMEKLLDRCSFINSLSEKLGV